MSTDHQKLQRETRKIELVETHNIALSLQRIANAPGGYSDTPKKRALYHAICMTHTFSTDEQRNIRIALNLP